MTAGVGIRVPDGGPASRWQSEPEQSDSEPDSSRRVSAAAAAAGPAGGPLRPGPGPVGPLTRRRSESPVTAIRLRARLTEPGSASAGPSRT